MAYDLAIVGGGIVGLATALAVTRTQPGAKVLLLEKEAAVARHQSGHNSGVIHSGIYYKPGSAKARFCKAGNRSMVEFCQRHGVPYRVCGKVIVATTPDEVPMLDALYRRGLEHGLDVERIGPGGVRDIEPHVSSLGGIRVASTGVVDFRLVAAKYAELLEAAGGEIRLNAEVVAVTADGGRYRVETTAGNFDTAFVVNCAGLHSDRVGRLAGDSIDTKIVPFRGEYYELVPERRHLVNSLVYPVPNPAFPFLGVHFTRRVDGRVDAGPNAVLGLKREAYRKRDVDAHDTFEVLTYGGFWKLASKNAREGLKEMVRSYSKRAFVRSLQRLVPEIEAADLVPAAAGVRAQALRADGQLVDDFLITHGPRSLNVYNAPSPAATCSLEIGAAVAAQVPVLSSARSA